MSQGKEIRYLHCTYMLCIERFSDIAWHYKIAWQLYICMFPQWCIILTYISGYTICACMALVVKLISLSVNDTTGTGTGTGAMRSQLGGDGQHHAFHLLLAYYVPAAFSIKLLEQTNYLNFYLLNLKLLLIFVSNYIFC